MHAIARVFVGWVLGSAAVSCVERDGLSSVADAGFVMRDTAQEGSGEAPRESGSTCSPLPSPGCGTTCCGGEAPRCALSLSGGATCQPEGTLLAGVGCGANQTERCASGLVCAGGWDQEDQPLCRLACDPREATTCESSEVCADLSGLFGAPAGACVRSRSTITSTAP